MATGGWVTPEDGTRTDALPDIGSGKIARVDLVKKDVRDHSAVPLAAHQGFDLLPGAIQIEIGKPQGCKCAVPVPLIGVKPLGRHRVATPVIAAKDVAGVVQKISSSLYRSCCKTFGHESLQPQKQGHDRQGRNHRTGHQMLSRDFR